MAEVPLHAPLEGQPARPFMDRWPVLALIFLAALLRFAGLESKSLWVDEATGLRWNQAPLEKILERCRATHTPPLREFYLHGVNQLPRPLHEGASRLPAALFGSLLPLLLYGLGRRFFNRETAWSAALLALFHPWLIQHSQDGRLHIVVLFLSLAMLGRLAALLENPRFWLGWALWGALVAFFAWFSYLLLLPGLACLGLYGLYLGRALFLKSHRPPLKPLLLGGVISLAVFLVLYSPWLFQLRHVLALYLPGYTPPPVAEISRPDYALTAAFHTRFDGAYFENLLQLLGGSTPWLWAMIPALTLWGFCAALRHKPFWALALAFWLLAPVPVLMVTDAGHFFPHRYLLYWAGPFLLLAAYGLQHLVHFFTSNLRRGDRFSPKPTRALLWGILLGAILLGHCIGAIRYYRAEKQNWRDAVTWLEKQCQPGDTILVGDNFAGNAVRLYQSPHNRQGCLWRFDLFDIRAFYGAVLDNQRVWYIYWAPPPDYIQRLLDREMKMVIRFPGFLGDVKILQKPGTVSAK